MNKVHPKFGTKEKSQCVTRACQKRRCVGVRTCVSIKHKALASGRKDGVERYCADAVGDVADINCAPKINCEHNPTCKVHHKTPAYVQYP